MWLLILGILLFCTDVGKGDLSVYECPSGWDEYLEHCYKYVRFPTVDLEGGKRACQVNGAYLLSVNDYNEHTFVTRLLGEKDSGVLRQDWWTSGRRKSDAEYLTFYWEGDSSEIQSYTFWHNDSIPSKWRDRNYILYNYNGNEWGWILGQDKEPRPYVCEISKKEIYKIVDEKRGPDYGVENPDPSTWEIGPKFTEQPVDTIFDMDDIKTFAEIEAVASALPSPTYKWYKEQAGVVTPVDPKEDQRYTVVNGKLFIDQPSAQKNDSGNYQCLAENKYGSVFSNQVKLQFGYLHEFAKSPRAPVKAQSYSWSSIECNPPSHFPDVVYAWYKDTFSNFIRPELKPYIFISNDGRLYFSEVNTDDAGQYYCIVSKAITMGGKSTTSMPIPLQISSGSPAIYEPTIDSHFPLVFPKGPLVGDNVTIECFAHGTSSPPLLYSWTKVEITSHGQEVRVPMPKKAKLLDHNRVLSIPNVEMYDAGHYRCQVSRIHGQTVNKTRQLILQARPYFILELEDKYEDIGKELLWRCEVGGVPTPNYRWYKNGEVYTQSSVPPEDQERIKVSFNSIHFTQLEMKDSAMYQCSASNTHGVRFSTAQLKVLKMKPSFTKYPLQKNQLATLRGNTTLLCRPEAAPIPTLEEYTWYKDGNQLNPSTDSGSRVRKMPNGNLVIDNIQMSDSGHYKCHVRNSEGEAETTGNVTVLTTTTISYVSDKMTVRVNGSSMLFCVASYNPQLDVTYVWYQNNIPIEFERIYRTGDNQYTVWHNPHYRRGPPLYPGGLYVMNADWEHKGQYKCQVESSSGTMSRVVDLTVVGPPFQPAGVRVIQGTITTTSCRITWKASEVVSTILSFVIEGYNEWEGFWRILRTNVPTQPIPGQDDTYEASLTNLRPYSTYKIRVRTETRDGTSVPSDPCEPFQTFAVKPDMYPEEVGGGGGKVGTLQVTWKALHPWQQNGNGIGYIVKCRNAGDEEWDKIETVRGNANHHVFHLEDDNSFYRLYDVSVEPFNDIGQGPPSPVVQIYSAMDLPSGIPENVRAQPFNSTAVLVHWEPVLDTRQNIKGKLGGYRLSYWKEVGEDEIMAPRVTVTGQGSEGLVIGLDPDTMYHFDVMVWNDAGNGRKSKFFPQRTLRSAPINQPTEVKVILKGNRAVHVYWRGVSTTNEEEPLEGYRVRLWREGEGIKVAKDYEAGKGTDMYIDGLRPDILYKLRVFGWSRGGDGTMSSPTMKFMLGAGHSVCTSWWILLAMAMVTQLAHLV